MSARWLAQRVLTGQTLYQEVPYATNGSPTEVLSGPGMVSGTITPELGAMIGEDGDPIFDEWGTALYYEIDGAIRWGGLVYRSQFSAVTQGWALEATGFSAYPAGFPYQGSYRPANGKVDPFDAVREIWAHVQATPESNLGLVVDAGASGITIGDPDGERPYELLWWDHPDCGEEVSSLASTTPFEYVEAHDWAQQVGFTDPITTATPWQAVSGPAPTVVSGATGAADGKVLHGEAPSGTNKWWAHRELVPFDPALKYRVTARVRHLRGSTDTAKNKVFVGVAGVAADGATLVNIAGANSWSAQHYVAADTSELPEASGWVTYTGYLAGHGGTPGGAHPDPNTPATAHVNVAYLRPVVLGTYSGGDGIFELDSFSIEIVGGARGGISHRLILGYPRLGSRRSDLRFAVGENVTVVPEGTRDGADWASDVVVFGAGENIDKLRAFASRPTGRRLRRWKTVDAVALRFPAQLTARAQKELAATGAFVEFTSISVADTPHARPGALRVGDDICVLAEIPWIGEVALWHRVVSREIPTGGVPATLGLLRTERFQ